MSTTYEPDTRISRGNEAQSPHPAGETAHSEAHAEHDHDHLNLSRCCASPLWHWLLLRSGSICGSHSTGSAS